MGFWFGLRNEFARERGKFLKKGTVSKVSRGISTLVSSPLKMSGVSGECGGGKKEEQKVDLGGGGLWEANYWNANQKRPMRNLHLAVRINKYVCQRAALAGSNFSLGRNVKNLRIHERLPGTLYLNRTSIDSPTRRDATTDILRKIKETVYRYIFFLVAVVRNEYCTSMKWIIIRIVFVRG